MQSAPGRPRRRINAALSRPPNALSSSSLAVRSAPSDVERLAFPGLVSSRCTTTIPSSPLCGKSSRLIPPFATLRPRNTIHIHGTVHVPRPRPRASQLCHDRTRPRVSGDARKARHTLRTGHLLRGRPRGVRQGEQGQRPHRRHLLLDLRVRRKLRTVHRDQEHQEWEDCVRARPRRVPGLWSWRHRYEPVLVPVPWCHF